MLNREREDLDLVNLFSSVAGKEERRMDTAQRDGNQKATLFRARVDAGFGRIAPGYFFGASTRAFWMTHGTREESNSASFLRGVSNSPRIFDQFAIASP